MTETNNTPDPNILDTAAASDHSSPMTSSPLFLHSSPLEGNEGETLMRAADTPMESSPAPTGVTIETMKKRKRVSNRGFGDADDEDEEEEVINPKKKGKGKKVGTGKSVCSRPSPTSLILCVLAIGAVC